MIELRANLTSSLFFIAYLRRGKILDLATKAPDLRSAVLKTLAVRLDPSLAGSAAPNQYAFDPHGYMRKVLGWEPWKGSGDHEPGQWEILEAYRQALLAQQERYLFSQGQLDYDDLVFYSPNRPIQNWIRVEAGHTTGKTYCVAGVVCHFFDSFNPSITYAFAPTYPQINDLLFKYIREHRQSNNLPGRLLERPELKDTHNHYAKGRATTGGKTEAVQGQHEECMLFVIDEAEGVEDYVFDAIESMASGGRIVIVILLANPRTRTSGFYKLAARSFVKSLRMSCLNHPNVRTGKDEVPNAVRRDYVEMMLEKHCEPVDSHEPDRHTFEIDWKPGIFLPNPEFMFRVMGVPPASSSADTFAPVGRFESAERRAPYVYESQLNPERKEVGLPSAAYIGIDAARYGDDAGTIYLRIGDNVERKHRIAKQDGWDYYQKTRELCYNLPDNITKVEIRVDGGGGYGSTVVDNIRREMELVEKFEEFDVYEVMFNTTAVYDPANYYDLVTEMYYHAGESLKVLSIANAPNALKADLCERAYRFVKSKGRDVKKLVSKEDFRTKNGRSPDDGDGFVLAVAPSYLFARTVSVGFA